MLTQLLRIRPALGFALALLISAFVTLVGVGGAIAGAADSPGTAVFLGFVGAVGVLVLVLLAGAVGAAVALGEAATTWVVISVVVTVAAPVLLLPVLARRVRAVST